MNQNILVINSGSSSIKFSLFNMTLNTESASGLAERMGGENAVLTVKSNLGKQTIELTASDYNSTLSVIINELTKQNLLENLPIAIGHRVVHGGEFFSDPVIVNESVIDKIRQCIPLAPLHNPANIAGIEGLAQLYPNIPQVAVFDTAFHQTIPQTAYLYGVPFELYQELKVRRYGFHGVSHKYVASVAANRLKLEHNHGIITAHLGNGSSACAVLNGKSVDTTMGMTPLEGLIMGTRSGDVDPGLHQFLSQQKGWDVDKTTSVLNKESGLLGLSGLSNDMRELVEASNKGNQRATLAIDVFCFRLARQIGALATSLSKLDALVFTGGIGENARLIRTKVVSHLKIFGFEIDENTNQNNGGESGIISTENGPAILVINTAEEKMIAQEAYTLVTQRSVT